MSDPEHHRLIVLGSVPAGYTAALCSPREHSQRSLLALKWVAN